MPARFRVELAAAYDRDAVAGQWRILEEEACRSFFLSWTWISTWLESLAAPPLLVRVWQDEKVSALGFLAPATMRRRLVVRSRQLHLHQSGDPVLDRIAAEFNGLLVHSAQEAEIVPLVLAHLRELPWDECILPGVPSSYAGFAADAGYGWSIDSASPNFTVDIADLRRSGEDLVQTLSANSRGQLRRALRLAEAEGPLALEAAGDLEQAMLCFSALAALERSRRGAQGAFASSACMRFHQDLIAKGHARGEVELLQARAGIRTLGYLYQFCYRGRVLAYQCAYPPSDDNRRHLGLVMHYLAVERAKTQGHSLYDFLAGEARYKRSLGREEQKLIWLRLQRPRLLLGLERGARRMKAAMRPWFATAPATSAPARDRKNRRPA